MEALIVIPDKHKSLFKIIVEDAHGGKLISTKGPATDKDDFGGQTCFLICKIEYKSPQSLFDMGVDFAIGCFQKKKEEVAIQVKEDEIICQHCGYNRGENTKTLLFCTGKSDSKRFLKQIYNCRNCTKRIVIYTVEVSREMELDLKQRFKEGNIKYINK